MKKNSAVAQAPDRTSDIYIDAQGNKVVEPVFNGGVGGVGGMLGVKK